MLAHPRTFAIGDIHGCSHALEALLAAVAPMPDDLIITLGDYVDRGPNSAGVVDRLIRLSNTHQLIPLRGNHEEMMIDARRSPELFNLWIDCGGGRTLLSYGSSQDAPNLAPVLNSHWSFLDITCRDLYQTENHFFVHGGVEAELSFEQQSPHVIHWEKFPPPRRHVSGKTMVCGHTPQLSGIPASLPHAICLDTGAGHGGWLSCLEVTTGRLWQANEGGDVRDSVLKAPRRRW